MLVVVLRAPLPSKTSRRTVVRKLSWHFTYFHVHACEEGDGAAHEGWQCELDGTCLVIWADM